MSLYRATPGAKVLLTDEFSPGDMDPWTGDEILVFGMRRHGEKASYAAG